MSVTDVRSSAGARLVDHVFNTESFDGIAVDDLDAPTVVATDALDHHSVLVRFSEPVSPNAAGPASYAISDPGAVALPVTGVALNDVATEAVLTTMPMVAGVVYDLNVTGLSDTAGNAMGPTIVSFTGVAADISGDVIPPRVVGANATNNTTVVVTFSEPVAAVRTAREPRQLHISPLTPPAGVNGQALLVSRARCQRQPAAA